MEIYIYYIYVCHKYIHKSRPDPRTQTLQKTSAFGEEEMAIPNPDHDPRARPPVSPGELN